MARRSSDSSGFFREALDKITGLGLTFGGGLFAITSIYLLYGALSGSLANIGGLSQADQERIFANVMLGCRMMTISGITALLSAAIRFYREEVTGYLLLIGGALLYWGIPMAIASSAQTWTQGSAVPVFVSRQFGLVGIVALVAAPPFILMDLWLKVTGSRQVAPSRPEAAREVTTEKARLPLTCWQMPYCRDYLRKFCKAHNQKKPCWRIKSGCYCDEDLILRSMKGASSASKSTAGFDPKFSMATAGRSKDLTAAQKRERCRQCFLYGEHQKLKYRLISPLVFPVVAALMWFFQEPARNLLHRGMVSIDHLAEQVSFLPGGKDVGMGDWASATSTSGVVEWVFLLCIGLVMVTYMLRGLEYLIFELQI